MAPTITSPILTTARRIAHPGPATQAIKHEDERRAGRCSRPGARRGGAPTVGLTANPIYRVDISPRGATSAISAINFLMSKLPKELKSFATRTKAPGPPITLSR
jgi:hypothetical protein